MSEQLDLFSGPLSDRVLREEERFGGMDAICGLPLRNHYSERISGDRLEAYRRGYRNSVLTPAI